MGDPKPAVGVTPEWLDEAYNEVALQLARALPGRWNHRRARRIAQITTLAILRKLSASLPEAARPQPSEVGGTITDVAGDPMALRGAIVDTERAVVLDEVTVCAVHFERIDQPAGAETVGVALELAGRINRTTNRVRGVYVMGLEGAAQIVTELLALAARMGDPRLVDAVIGALTDLDQSITPDQEAGDA